MHTYLKIELFVPGHEGQAEHPSLNAVLWNPHLTHLRFSYKMEE